MARDDEPVTPAGRLFLQPQMDQVIHGIIAAENPIDVDDVKRQIESSVMLQHPRFCSLLVRDSCGREHWRRTQVHLDSHVIVRLEPLSSLDDIDSVNDYVAELTVSTPLSTDKPLWELHLLLAHKTAVFRVHHALGDGVSLMSMLLSACRLRDDPTRAPSLGVVSSSHVRSDTSMLWRWVKMAWFTLVYMLEFVLRSLWLSDRTTAVSGGAGVELWPRKLATARFRLEDMKAVKRATNGSTINDVLFGVISSGLSKYLDMQSPNEIPDGLRLTGLAMVNLRPQAGLQDMSKLMNGKSRTRWGNKFGMILLPVYYKKGSSDPLHFVRRSKSMIDKKKLSLEALCSYKIGYIVMSLLGAKFASLLNYRIICNTTFTISNMIGPQEAIILGDNPVKYIRVTVTSLPHALTMHMMSYAGFADLQILVAKEIIPEPKVLAKCFEDALLEMKQIAEKEE